MNKTFTAMNNTTKAFYDTTNARANKAGAPIEKNDGLAIVWTSLYDAGVPIVNVSDKKRVDGLHAVIGKTNIRVCYGKSTLLDCYARKGMIRVYISKHARLSCDKDKNVTLKADTRKACKQVNTSAQKAYLYDVYVSNKSILTFLKTVINMPKAPADNDPADVLENVQGIQGN